MIQTNVSKPVTNYSPKQYVIFQISFIIPYQYSSRFINFFTVVVISMINFFPKALLKPQVGSRENYIHMYIHCMYVCRYRWKMRTQSFVWMDKISQHLGATMQIMCIYISRSIRMNINKHMFICIYFSNTFIHMYAHSLALVTLHPIIYTCIYVLGCPLFLQFEVFFCKRPWKLFKYIKFKPCLNQFTFSIYFTWYYYWQFNPKYSTLQKSWFFNKNIHLKVAFKKSKNNALNALRLGNSITEHGLCKLSAQTEIFFSMV